MTSSDSSPTSSAPVGSNPPLEHLSVEIGVGMMGSEDALRSILATVDLNLTGNIPDIWKALEADDIAVANRLLHGIKGYVPIFCTDPLVDQVTQTEVFSKTASAADVKPLFAELAPKLEQLLVEIRAFIAQG